MSKDSGPAVREIIVDNFAGGGGASTGIEMAIGRSVDIAINHDPAAIAMHRANHPGTEHYCESVWDVDPREVTKGRGVALCWLSPDCKHFSKAKGGKPVEKHIRGLAWVAVRWAATVRPRVIMLENVEEFKAWGPLLKDDRPDPEQKGRTFNSFVNALKRQGYQVECKELRACDYGAPTIRKRLFLIARCDGHPIVWPRPTHGDPNSAAVKSSKLKPWRTAAEIIDWSIPCPSIFDRKKPLAENTMLKIARGIQRFVLENPNPFIIKVNHKYEQFRGQQINEPMQTVTATNGWDLVTPFLTQYHSYEGDGARGQILDRPLLTQDTSNRYALTVAFLMKYYGGGYKGPGADLNKPTPTVTTKDHNALVTSHLIKLRGTCRDGQPVTEPMPTVTAGGLHVGEVRVFLLKYYGTNIGQDCNSPLQTITTKHRFGLVTIHGQDYQIVDICMRMLEPHELFAAHSFPSSYIIDRGCDGNRFSKALQVSMCGNAVPPLFAEHLVRANLPELCIPKNRDRFSEMDLEALLS